ncbi:membrane-bound PQQ-dependent dehydrogenase, glucose/quinate/shikimate family, partial [Rhizobium johnstonii]
LDLAWTYRTGKGDGADQNTPLHIGDTVYTCTPTDLIAALDADTGKPRWTFDPKATAPYWQRCRCLGYYKMPMEAQSADGLCRARRACCR